jgi:hypothetical protein
MCTVQLRQKAAKSKPYSSTNQQSEQAIYSKMLVMLYITYMCVSV